MNELVGTNICLVILAVLNITMLAVLSGIL